jgi:pimeloyl-ACP methyl ester carboxylesterase
VVNRGRVGLVPADPPFSVPQAPSRRRCLWHVRGVRELLLVHGGLWGETDADRFWRRPGVVAALESRGAGVIAPDRVERPREWRDEVDHLAAALGGRGPVTVVAGSNGCSAGLLLALARPDLVDRLLLAWPATAGDTRVDAEAGARLRGLGATAVVVEAVLAGQTVRGVADADIRAVAVPVGLLPSEPHNPFHQRRTVEALRLLLPGAEVLPGGPEPPSPAFVAARFADSAIEFVTGGGSAAQGG